MVQRDHYLQSPKHQTTYLSKPTRAITPIAEYKLPQMMDSKNPRKPEATDNKIDESKKMDNMEQTKVP